MKIELYNDGGNGVCTICAYKRSLKKGIEKWQALKGIFYVQVEYQEVEWYTHSFLHHRNSFSS